MHALRIAQKERGGPVYVMEVLQAFKKNSYFPMKPLCLVRTTLFSLFADDRILANRELTMFSIDMADQRTDDNETEFELYSDRMNRIASTYRFEKAEILKIYPGPDTPTVNLKWLFSILLSKDLSKDRELDWVKPDNYRFLDGENLDGWHTVFSSFPRSGNTMLRRWFE